MSNRNKILPNKVFHKIWNQACKEPDFKTYKDIFLSSDAAIHINYKKFNMDYEDFFFMLQKIHELSQLSFKDILDRAEKRKSEVSDIFCIPIRTVEEWYKGTNTCAPYIRLMILKEFHLLDIGKYIKIESAVEHEKNKPSVYQKHEVSTGQIRRQKSENKRIKELEQQLEHEKMKNKMKISERDILFYKEYGFWPSHKNSDYEL